VSSGCHNKRSENVFGINFQKLYVTENEDWVCFAIPIISLSRSIDFIIDQNFEIHHARNMLDILHTFHRRRPHIV